MAASGCRGRRDRKTLGGPTCGGVAETVDEQRRRLLRLRSDRDESCPGTFSIIRDQNPVAVLHSASRGRWQSGASYCRPQPADWKTIAVEAESRGLGPSILDGLRRLLPPRALAVRQRLPEHFRLGRATANFPQSIGTNCPRSRVSGSVRAEHRSRESADIPSASIKIRRYRVSIVGPNSRHWDPIGGPANRSAPVRSNSEDAQIPGHRAVLRSICESAAKNAARRRSS